MKDLSPPVLQLVEQARLDGIRLGLEAAAKALFDKRRHLAARDIAMIEDIDPATIAGQRRDNL